MVQTDNTQQPILYDMVGGEEKLRLMVDAFYDFMESDVRFQGIRALHPESLDNARNRLFWFLSGWMGGPNLYIEQFGHPRLRARHLPFPIGESERDQWLQCMALALDHINMEQNLQQRLMQAFYDTADWMRNQAGR